MSLPEPDFVERDPVALTADMIEAYEAYTGRTLQPAQVERLIIDLLAYRESLVRISIQEAAKQNLLAFARYPMLDYLGELLGVERLAEAPALTTLRFTLAEPQGAPLLIPTGTRARTRDRKITFETDRLLEIAPGDTQGEVSATAREAGDGGNGYALGQVSSLLDPIAGVASVANVTMTYAGRSGETDDRLRERIRAAPERLSVAGPAGAYRWHAMSAHQSIVDAAPTSPRAGRVRVHILTDEGLPSAELLDLVDAALSDDRVRPLTDTVEVVPPERVGFDITGEVTLYREADPDVTMEAVRAAAGSWAAGRRAGLGRDIVPSQIVAALSVSGVYRVTLSDPAFRELGTHEWADCEAITLTLAGVVDG